MGSCALSRLGSIWAAHARTERCRDAPCDTRAPVPPGPLLDDRFALERLAGAGGMGSVYRARDLATGDLVAVKVLASTTPHDLRFTREAELLSSMSHPGIVRYVAHGVAVSGERYLAMEWLDGHDLSVRLRERGLSISEGVRLATRIAEALGHAHARGVVHRDVKPGNLFLVGGDVDAAKVIDFGIARGHDLGAGTRTGAILGTPGYLAPEQARGGRDVDPRADVFSLGCVLFEALTGRAPFVGEHFVAVLAKILAERAPAVRDLRPDAPDELDALVASMLAKEAADRPPNGAAVADALRSLGSLDGDRAGAPKRLSSPSLTAREQELVSVILVAQDAGGDDATEAPTVASQDQVALFARLRDAVAPFDATLEALVGGASLATMTREGAGTDHAARAARCALAIRGARPGVAIVLATGRATLADRLPVGAVIDRAASWLRRLRAEGSRALVVDEVTAGLLDARFELREAAHAPGMELVAEREAAPTGRTLLGRPTACVGRERELTVLMGAWEACVAGPAPQTVLVTGPAGAGKSRLRQEFLRRLAERREAPSVWLAAADAVGARSPFGVISRWVRSASGIVDGDRVEVRRQKLRARLARHLSAPDLDRATAFLGEVSGASLADDSNVELRAARRDAALMGAQLRRVFSGWIAAEADAAPLALVVEDLQWGDPSSVRALVEALASLGERAVMLLAMARPEVREDFPELLEGDGTLALSLGPLTSRVCAQIARSALGEGATDAVISRLVERCEGNALFLEELVRAVAVGDDAVPETVLAMVSARLDRLDPPSRRVLRAASVFGREFDGDGARALLGGSDRTTQVEDRLRQLVDAEVIVRRGDGFAFRHALLRDASYALLTEGDRRLGHRLAGEWLVARGEVDAATLAEHFERGDRPELASPWCRRAAERSLDGGALIEALTWAERAQKTGASDVELGRVRRVEARARSLRDENAEAARCGEEALSLLPVGSALWHDVAADLATTTLRMGAHERLASLARALADAEAPAEATASRVIALARTAIHCFQAGLNAEGGSLRERLAAHPSGGSEEPAVRAWRARIEAVEALRGGDPSAYLALTGRAAECFEAAGDRASACAQRGNVGYAYLELGAHARAVTVLRAELAAAIALGVRSTAGLIRHNLGLALALGGALDEGAAVEREALAGFVAQGHRRLEGFARSYLARIAARSGDFETATREAATAVSLHDESTPSRAYALAVLAEVLGAAGDTVASRAAAERAALLLDQLGGVEEGESLIRLVDAETRRATGDREGAERVIGEAVRRLRERADAISALELRASFLEAVPENARSIEREVEWRGMAVARRGD